MKRWFLTMLVAVSALAMAQQPPLVGAWQGKMSVLSKPGASADDKKLDAIMGSMLGKIKIDLQLKADRTFVIEALKPGDKKPERMEGKWSIEGKTLTLETLKQNGKPPAKKEPAVFTLSGDGKSLSQKVTPGKDEVKIDYKRKG